MQHSTAIFLDGFSLDEQADFMESIPDTVIEPFYCPNNEKISRLINQKEKFSAFVGDSRETNLSDFLKHLDDKFDCFVYIKLTKQESIWYHYMGTNEDFDFFAVKKEQDIHFGHLKNLVKTEIPITILHVGLEDIQNNFKHFSKNVIWNIKNGPRRVSLKSQPTSQEGGPLFIIFIFITSILVSVFLYDTFLNK